MSTPDLTDRIILVTGAGGGIGAAVSRALAAHGATVALLGRSARGLERVYDGIVEAGGPEPAICHFKLESEPVEAYEQLAATLDEHFGRLDGLLHNAALLHGLTPLANLPLQEWVRAMQVNLNAPYLLTRACLPLLKKSADASVVFTLDGAALEGRAYYGAYGVSKWAQQGLAQMLARECEANTAIRVNTIDPGPVATQLRTTIATGSPASDFPSPDTVVPAYLHLLGPDSRGRTGQNWNADQLVHQLNSG